MALRYAGKCVICGRELNKGERAWWDAEARVVYCLPHRPDVRFQSAATSAQPSGTEPPHAATSPDLGTAGRSAQREHDRRVANRQRKVRDKHPIIGGALLAAFDDPQSTRAWRNGAIGERAVGQRLDALGDHGVIALHDRQIPGSRANIDHIAIGPSGVFVIDAKFRKSGRVVTRRSGTLFRPGPSQLYVGGRNLTGLVGKMAGQMAVVLSALERMPEAAVTPVRPMLTFVNAEWGMFASPIDIAGVLVVWPKEMARLVSRSGPLRPEAVQRIAEHLTQVLKSA